MSDKLYILHATIGSDDVWESIILGVYSSWEEADENKRKISDAVTSYYQKVSANNVAIIAGLAEWTGKVMPAPMVGRKEREISNTTEVFTAYCKLLGHVESFRREEYTNSAYFRNRFFETADEIISRLPDWVEVQSLPNFPPVIQWEESHPLVYSYLTRVTRVSVERRYQITADGDKNLVLQ